MADFSDFKATFFQECKELLESMEGGLMAIDGGEDLSSHIDSIFRAVHSVKGGAGAFGYDRLVEFAHVFETVLDHVRQGILEPQADVLQTLLKAGDILADLVGKAEANEEVPDGFGQDVRSLLHELESRRTGGGDSEAPMEEFDGIDFAPVPVEASEDESAPAEFDGIDFTPVPVEASDDASAPAEFDGIDFTPVPADETGPASATVYRIAFAPRPEMYRRSNEPLLLFRELRRLGSMAVQCDTAGLPLLEQLQPDGAYLKWTLELTTDAPVEQVQEAFEFVEDDCDLAITRGDAPSAPAAVAPPEPKIEAPVTAPASPAVPPPPPPVEAAPAVAAPVAPPAPAQPSAPEAARKDPAEAGRKDEPGITIRVDLNRVDRVVDMVGELVIAQAMLRQTVAQLPHDGKFAELERGMEQLFQISRELQESVMAIRAQPVRSVFQRMPRLVRELSAQTGKKARLVMHGEATEIDKTVTERLADPLTHMIRNALDHGIETPAERIAAGKPDEGVVQISAEHKGGRIIIQLSDDGRGINRDRVRAKAIEKGLIAPEAVLSDEEVDQLIFAPGFSTAATVSNISGRGVGMDVVKRNVQELGGRVVIRSTPGKGSTVSLTLPLTLAVMDGMVVSCGRETYIVPISSIIECLRPQPGMVQRAGDGGDVLVLRGEVVPLQYLGRVFHIAEAKAALAEGVIVVVEVEGGAKLGLVVDDLLGQQQVVVKSIEENFGAIDGIGAATIMGDGQVALILDVDALAQAGWPATANQVH